MNTKNLTVHEALMTNGGKKAALVKEDQHGRKFSERLINPDKHIFQQEDAICYDNSVLNEAKKKGIRYHVIKIKGKKRYATPEMFDEKGILVRFKGKEPQTGLCLDDWIDGDEPEFVEEAETEVSDVKEAA